MSALDDVLAEIDELDSLANTLARRSASLKAKVRAYKASLGRGGAPDYVGEDGRLTEAGVRYCEAAFKDGRGPSEIARALGVTVPAIVMRRKRWIEEQEEKARGRKGAR